MTASEGPGALVRGITSFLFSRLSAAGCSAWTQGLWPYIDDNGDIVNGGVPQAANLTAHLDYLRSNIDAWMPDVDWNGNAVFDFENW